jgi:hypothetical protein
VTFTKEKNSGLERCAGNLKLVGFLRKIKQLNFLKRQSAGIAGSGWIRSDITSPQLRFWPLSQAIFGIPGIRLQFPRHLKFGIAYPSSAARFNGDRRCIIDDNP